MLMAVDVGNTNTVVGVFDGKNLLAEWRLTTEPHRTMDEYGLLFTNLYSTRNLSHEYIDSVIISCVVPPMLNMLEQLCVRYFGTEPFVVGPGIKTGMPIHYDSPKEVGADRIVNAVAAYEIYGGDLIIIDFGTATTFDYISPEGEYEGGAIAPGITVSSEALFNKAAKLPRVDLKVPRTVIGKETVTSMQAGIMFGYAGLVDGIVERMKKEAGTNPRVIATGGLADVMASIARTIDEVNHLLTLEGLRILYERNKDAR